MQTHTENVNCRHCGTAFSLELSIEIANNEMLKSAQIDFACCKKCEEIHNQRIKMAQQQEKLAEIKNNLALRYEDRLDNSNLKCNTLSYSDKHEDANQKLENFIKQNANGSMWICGITGKCKTRLVQKYAKLALKDRSVYYTTSFDLMNKIAALFAKKQLEGNKFLNELYKYDLLVIDDVGKEQVSPAKMKYFFNLLDKRYIADDYNQKFSNGLYDPLYRKEYFHGFQIWLTSNDDGRKLIGNMEIDDKQPAIRRLTTLCKIYEEFK